MTPIAFSRGSSKLDAYPAQRTVPSFDAFEVAVLSDRAKRKGQTYIAAPFRTTGSGSKAHRCAADALPRAFLPFDFDGVCNAEIFADVCLWLSRYRGFGYTTARHAPNVPRARIILQASRAVDRRDGERVCVAIQRMIETTFGVGKIKFDPSVYRAEQPCFTPLVDAQTFRFDGERVDVDALLAALPEDTRVAGTIANPEPDTDLRQHVLRGDASEIYPALVSLSARLIGRGMPANDATAVLHTLLDECEWKARDPKTWRARYNSVAAMVKSAVKKYADKREKPAGPAQPEQPALLLDPKGKPIACEFNVAQLITHGVCFDEFWRSIMWTHTDGTRRAWTDADDRSELVRIQHERNIPRVTLPMVRTAVEYVANANRTDALREFIEMLPRWDGTPRIEYALHKAFGAPDTPLMRAASPNLLRAMIARALQPGAKVDHLYVFEGAQGTLKSMGLDALGGEFHVEVTEPLGSANCVREIRCAWLAELSELKALVGRDAETSKAFITRQADPIVEKWEKRVSVYPRRCVFVGTTNEARYWDDPTGARRLVPIPTGEIRPDLIKANRLQWFAEAKLDYEAGRTWWELPDDIDDEREERQKLDPWQEPIEHHLVGKAKTTVAQLLDALGVSTDRREPRHEVRVAACLRRAGWHSLPRRREGGKRIRQWIRNGGDV